MLTATKKDTWATTFKSTDLPSALSIIAPAITNKTIWGNHFLLQISPGERDEFDDPYVTLIANNGLQEIRRRITITDFDSNVTDDSIELCLPYDPFVRALDGAGGSVSLVVTQKTVTVIVPGVNGPASQAVINTIPNGPVYPEHDIDISNMVVIQKAGELYKAIGLVKVATSGSPTDTVRNAIRLRTVAGSDSPSQIVLEAADSYHAARVYGPIIELDEDQDTPAIDINIPAQHVASLKNLAGEMWIAADERRVHVRCGRVYWSSVLVEGKFPDIGRVMTSPRTASFIIKTDALRNRVRQASAFGHITVANNVKFSKVNLALDPDDLKLSINADTSVYGSFSATESVIEAHSDEGEASINLDATVFLKGLSGVDAKEVCISVMQEGRTVGVETEKEFHFISTVLN